MVDTTSRLVFGEIGHEEFVAQCNQAAAVDVEASAAAYARLIGDASLRQQMGEMGRRRAVEQFAWPRIIRSYERLWGEQERERLARYRRGRTRPTKDTTVQPCILPWRPHSSATPSASGCEKRTGS